MKKLLPVLPVVLLSLILLSSCATVIPNSLKAKERLEKAGYEVERYVLSGEEAELQGLKQMVQINAYREGELCLQIYYFSNEEDTNTFYRDHQDSLQRGQEVFKKNRYSIYRGTYEARNVFLRAD